MGPSTFSITDGLAQRTLEGKEQGLRAGGPEVIFDRHKEKRTCRQED
jgi:hypothetical protein